MNLFFRHLFPLVLLSLVVTCKTRPLGQILLALDTDLSIPKDIASIRVAVTFADTGEYIWQRTFRDFPETREAPGTRLPATIGFWAPEGSDRPIRVAIVARDQRGTSHVLPEIITTIPDQRTVTLPVRVEFLCHDFQIAPTGQLDDDHMPIWKSTCAPLGFVCRFGECVPPDIGSETLPDYDPGSIFGGGTGTGDGSCFDAASCFEDAIDVEVALVEEPGKPSACIGTSPMPFPEKINVALRTQGLGMCGKTGCFVALDLGGAGGYSIVPETNNQIVVPRAVCDRVASGKVVAVAWSPASRAPCEQKVGSLPLCAPYSASGSALGSDPDPDAPALVAAAQVNPISFTVLDDGISWASQGKLDANGASLGDGTVKFLPFGEAGEPKVVASAQRAPAGVAWDAARRFLLFTVAQGLNGGYVGFSRHPLDGTFTAPLPLVNGLVQPSGIALSNGHVVFTEGGADEVHHIQTAVIGSSLVLAPGTQVDTYAHLDPPGVSPHAVVVAQNTACFTYEATLMDGKGVVACSPTSSDAGPLFFAAAQATPRSIVLNSKDFATHVYWANFGPSPAGAVMGAPIELDSTETLLDVDFPAGLALDHEAERDWLYVTSRNAGQILRIDMAEKLDGSHPVEVCVEGRQELGEVALDKDNLYWIELGIPKSPFGAIMRLPKSRLHCRPR